MSEPIKDNETNGAADEAALLSDDTATEDRPILTRTFEAIEMGTDGRNLEILCAPFNQPTQVADAPDYTPYMEEFLLGAFEGATRAPNRVLLDFEHQRAMNGVLGHGAELEERADALYGRFRITEHPDGDKALALIRDHVLTGASVMFKPLRSLRTPAGVVQRAKVHLDRVSLCRMGAYQEAKVLAVRNKTVKFDPIPELNEERLRALGINV